MVNKIVMASMSCIGESKEMGRFEDPVVKISLDPHNAARSETDGVLEYVVPLLFGDLILRVTTMYREATHNLDQPVFKMTLLKEDGTRLATVHEDYNPEGIRDTYYHFDRQDSALEYRISPDDITEGETLTFKVELESKLEQWEWSETQTKGEQLVTLAETDTITVKVTVNQIANVTFSALCTAGDIKDQYWVEADVDNDGNSAIEYVLACTEHGESTSDDVDLFYTDSAGVKHDARGSLTPGDHLFTSDPIAKDWVWWDEVFSFMSAVGPLEKSYKYYVQLTLADQSPTTIIVNKTVKVPQVKIDWANVANLAWASFLAHQALAIAYTAAAAFTCIPCIYAAVYEQAAAVISAALASDAKDKAKNRCAIQFDSNYAEIYDYDKQIKKPRTRYPQSLEGQSLNDIISKMISLSRGIDKTYERYLSALTKEKHKIAKRQVKHAEHMLSVSGKGLSFLKEQLHEFKENVLSTDGEARKPYLEKAVIEIKTNGLDKIQIADLRELGLTDKQIGVVEKTVIELVPDEIDLTVDVQTDDIYQKALILHHQAVETVNEMRRIHSLSNLDLQMELLKRGLISPSEFYKTRDQRNNESDYLITRLRWLNEYQKEKLAGLGIYSTSDLIEKCSTAPKMKQFSKRAGIPRGLLKKWITLAKFMRLKGLGDEHSEMLFEADVTNIVQLSKTNPEKLSKLMKTRREKRKFKKRAPSKSRIAKWKELAKEYKERD